ncbi:MAG: DUF2510 domain-containing protein [Actinomycetia bacterium]|nr:DUF2510 domain-containing protein [Actinomycetes bacterium]
MPAGWYPDPERTMPLRWWDGQYWTAWQAETAEAGYPPPGPVERVEPVEPPSPVLVRRALLGAAAGAAVLTGLGLWGRRLVAAEREPQQQAWPSVLGQPGRAAKQIGLTVETSGVVRHGSHLSLQLPPGWRPSQLTNLDHPLDNSVVGADLTTSGWVRRQSHWLPALICLAEIPLSMYLSRDLATSVGVLGEQVVGVLYSGTPELSHDPVTATAGPAVQGHSTGEAGTTVRYREQGGSSQARMRFRLIELNQAVAVLWTDIDPDVATEAQRQAQTKAWESLWLA